MNGNLNTINQSNISFYLAFVDCENENGTNCSEAATHDTSGHFHPTLISEYTLRYGLWGSVFLWFVQLALAIYSVHFRNRCSFTSQHIVRAYFHHWYFGQHFGHLCHLQDPENAEHHLFFHCQSGRGRSVGQHFMPAVHFDRQFISW